MTHLEEKLGQLKHSVIEMMELVEKQLEKSKEAFMTMDTELAEEIIYTEKRINAMELSIDRECEKAFALINPLASDLRFVISVLKINSDLERIGDYAESIANYVLDAEQPFEESYLNKLNIPKMFDIATSMLIDINTAFANENAKKARKIFKKDKELNKINKNASKVINEIVKKDASKFSTSLYIFSTIRKLERLGDHVTNMAENIIFHLEAKVLKHKGKRS